MTKRPLYFLTGAAALSLVLTGCVANNPTSAGLRVTITDDGCAVSAAETGAGTVKFTLSNSGSQVNEFEILAQDKLRIVGEKENITPGQTVDYVAHLAPGSYYTACKPGMVGAGVGIAAFSVTGEAAPLSGTEQEKMDQAVTNYISYVKAQAGELKPAVAEFTAAYRLGQDDRARELYPIARTHYERIEPTAEAFGDLDPRIDFREPMATEDGIDFTGFHRIEKDLWAPEGFTPSTPEERVVLADALDKDVSELYDLVYSPEFTVGIDDISNGAIGLLDEVAGSKITGEEDEFSHTDLYDFRANLEGASVAFGTVSEIATATGPAGAELVTTITKRFDTLTALLETHRTPEGGFVSYTSLDPAQIRALSDGINALSEPLSRLTHTVLGIAK